MGNTLKTSKLFGRSASRMLLAVSLSTSLAAVGCTTDRHLGFGDPSRPAPALRTAPTGGITTGQETAPLPPPMTSSYSRMETVAPIVIEDAPAVSDADRAAAIMAQHGRLSGRLLGPAMPANDPYVSDLIGTGNFTWPALQTNPQLTVNSSISSPSTPAIVSGAGGDAAPVIGSANTPAFTGAVTAPGSTVIGTTPGAAVFAPSGTPVTTPSPVPFVTPAARPLTVPAATAINPSRAGTIDGATGTAVRSNAVTAAASSVRAVTGADGRVTITNSGADQ